MIMNVDEVESYLNDALREAYSLSAFRVVPFIADSLTLAQNLNPGRVGFFGSLTTNQMPLSVYLRDIVPVPTKSMRTSFKDLVMSDSLYNIHAGYGLSATNNVPLTLFDEVWFQTENLGAGSWMQASGIRMSSYSGTWPIPILSFVGYRFNIQ